MKRSKIYVVIGETGEYDSFTCWNVCAFKAKKKAVELKRLCNQWLIKNGLHYRDAAKRPKIYDIKEENQKEIDRILAITYKISKNKLSNPYDPNLSYIEYSGAEYEIIEIDFKE